RVEENGQGVVPDGVEAGLHAGAGARLEMARDCVLVAVELACCLFAFEVLADAGREGPDGAVHEQVPARTYGTELAGLLDRAELAPVADALDAMLEREQTD